MRNTAAVILDLYEYAVRHGTYRHCNLRTGMRKFECILKQVGNRRSEERGFDLYGEVRVHGPDRQPAIEDLGIDVCRRRDFVDEPGKRNAGPMRRYPAPLTSSRERSTRSFMAAMTRSSTASGAAVVMTLPLLSMRRAKTAVWM